MDEAHDWTDKQIEVLQRKFGHVYSEAAKEMREKLEKHLKAYEKGNAEWQKLLANGVAKQKDYDKWLHQMVTDRKFMEGMVNRLSEDATAANQKAMDLINDHIPKVYAENANHAAYQVEKGLGWDTHSFDLYDESTVRRLMTATDQDQIIHEVIEVGPPRPQLQNVRKINFDKARDVWWNRQKFTSAITQSILQGESVPDTAKRLMRVLNMDRNMATRAARTAMTSAENAGRVDSYKRAKRIGINLEQEWMATLDERTRYSHRELDGQHVPVGGKFIAKSTGHELEFPADPKAHPSETYNCRCTLVAWFPGIEQEDPERWSRLPKGMSYDEWKDAKIKEHAEDSAAKAGTIAEGKDILGKWSRRSDLFEHEIEDILNAQGFDGLPRVVDTDEFNQMVGKANNGKGLVMQRSYSAPDIKTLDDYREQLYKGKWYVDCTTGGAQYGQGMYAAADYTGILSDGIKKEMQHYTKLGAYRNGEILNKEDYFARVKGDLEASGLLSDAAKKYAENYRKLEKAASEHKTVNSLYKQKNEIEKELGEDAARLRDIFESHPVFSGESYIETMTLDPSAKVISWKDAIKLQDEATDRFIKQGLTPEQVKQIMPNDTGSFAASMGFDAINAEGHGASGSYTIVLNRTKLIIRRPQ